MEAFGSPSISRAPMGGGHAFRIPKIVYADGRYNDNILSNVFGLFFFFFFFFFLRVYIL